MNIKDQISNNRRSLFDLYDQTQVTTTQNQSLELTEGLEQAVLMIKAAAERRSKLFFIGNGGSAAIASHMAVDFWKNLGIAAMTFNDGPLLTCLSNDEGYDQVFKRSVGMFAQKGDILVAISSSGQSQNILNAVQAAIEHEMQVITLSGFHADNHLRRCGDLNFYVPAAHYGYVEVLHHAICHCWVDTLMASKLDISEEEKITI